MANLRDIRKERGIRAAELAEAIGVPLATLYSWENGTRDIKKAAFEDVWTLAKILEVDAAELAEV